MGRIVSKETREKISRSMRYGKPPAKEIFYQRDPDPVERQKRVLTDEHKSRISESVKNTLSKKKLSDI